MDEGCIPAEALGREPNHAHQGVRKVIVLALDLRSLHEGDILGLVFRLELQELRNDGQC